MSLFLTYNIKKEIKTNKSMSRYYKNSGKCDSKYSNQGFDNVNSVLVSDWKKLQVTYVNDIFIFNGNDDTRRLQNWC